MKYILSILSLSLTLNATPDKEKPLIPREKPPIEKDYFGDWLDSEGYIIDGPKIRNWIDDDRDGVDDRMQSGPGKPRGKARPDKPTEPTKPKPKPKPRPVKPTTGIPTTGEGGNNVEPVRPSRPPRPSRPELSAELKTKLDTYKKEKDLLQSELKEIIKKLDKPNRNEVREAIAKFNEDNKSRITAHKELGKTIKDSLTLSRPERPKKPEVPAEMKKLHAAQKEVHKALHNAHKELRTKLQDVKGEEKEELLAAFKESQQKLHVELKNIQRQIREVQLSDVPAKSGERRSLRPPPRSGLSEKKNDRRSSPRR